MNFVPILSCPRSEFDVISAEIALGDREVKGDPVERGPTVAGVGLRGPEETIKTLLSACHVALIPRTKIVLPLATCVKVPCRYRKSPF